MAAWGACSIFQMVVFWANRFRVSLVKRDSNSQCFTKWSNAFFVGWQPAAGTLQLAWRNPDDFTDDFLSLMCPNGEKQITPFLSPWKTRKAPCNWGWSSAITGTKHNFAPRELLRIPGRWMKFPTSKNAGSESFPHRTGWWENLQESPIFDGKIHGFL
jgi:hypothetical protein